MVKFQVLKEFESGRDQDMSNQWLSIRSMAVTIGKDFEAVRNFLKYSNLYATQEVPGQPIILTALKYYTTNTASAQLTWYPFKCTM